MPLCSTVCDFDDYDNYREEIDQGVLYPICIIIVITRLLVLLLHHQSLSGMMFQIHLADDKRVHSSLVVIKKHLVPLNTRNELSFSVSFSNVMHSFISSLSSSPTGPHKKTHKRQLKMDKYILVRRQSKGSVGTFS